MADIFLLKCVSQEEVTEETLGSGVGAGARMEVCPGGEREIACRGGREVGGGLGKVSLVKSCILGLGIWLCWSVLTFLETDLLRCFL